MGFYHEMNLVEKHIKNLEDTLFQAVGFYGEGLPLTEDEIEKLIQIRENFSTGRCALITHNAYVVRIDDTYMSRNAFLANILQDLERIKNSVNDRYKEMVHERA